MLKSSWYYDVVFSLLNERQLPVKVRTICSSIQLSFTTNFSWSCFEVRLCYVGWVCFGYNFEMDGWSTKRGEAKVPVIPDSRPCFNNGFMGLVLPVAERHYCAENTHRLLLFRSMKRMQRLGSVCRDG